MELGFQAGGMCPKTLRRLVGVEDCQFDTLVFSDVAAAEATLAFGKGHPLWPSNLFAGVVGLGARHGSVCFAERPRPVTPLTGTENQPDTKMGKHRKPDATEAKVGENAFQYVPVVIGLGFRPIEKKIAPITGIRQTISISPNGERNIQFMG